MHKLTFSSFLAVKNLRGEGGKIDCNEFFKIISTLLAHIFSIFKSENVSDVIKVKFPLNNFSSYHVAEILNEISSFLIFRNDMHEHQQIFSFCGWQKAASHSSCVCDNSPPPPIVALSPYSLLVSLLIFCPYIILHGLVSLLSLSLSVCVCVCVCVCVVGKKEPEKI